MNKAILIVAALVLAAGCGGKGGSTTVGGTPTPLACDDKTKKGIKIDFEDSSISAEAKKEFNKNTDSMLLVIDGKGDPAYEDLKIHVYGEDATGAWLNVWASENDPDSAKTVCLENVPLGEYKYVVHVPGVGTLDPRVEVVDQ